jgi:hypothetical protein
MPPPCGNSASSLTREKEGTEALRSKYGIHAHIEYADLPRLAHILSKNDGEHEFYDEKQVIYIYVWGETEKCIHESVTLNLI